jgi:pimeloyl-ACP methyl ester carboxylesterase
MISGDAWKQSAEFGKVLSLVVILESRQDSECPVELADAAHRGIDGSEEVIFENSGHLPWLEEPQEFFPSLKQFLDRAHI